MSTEIKYEIKPFQDSPGTPTVKVFLRDLRNLGNKKGDDFGWTLTDNLDGVDAGGANGGPPLPGAPNSAENRKALAAFARSPEAKSDYRLTETERQQLSQESEEGERYHLHQRAYLYYMPVSILNFIGVGAIPIVLGVFASISDARRLEHVKRLIDQHIDCTSLPPQSVFRHFRRLCRNLSKKYLLMGAIFLGWLSVEFWIKSIAATAAGWSFVILLFMLSGVLVWLVCVTRYYSEVFETCRTSMESDDTESNDWSRENSTAAFLGDILIGTLAGRCLLVSLAICLFGYLPFYGR